MGYLFAGFDLAHDTIESAIKDGKLIATVGEQTPEIIDAEGYVKEEGDSDAED